MARIHREILVQVRSRKEALPKGTSGGGSVTIWDQHQLLIEPSDENYESIIRSLSDCERPSEHFFYVLTT